MFFDFHFERLKKSINILEYSKTDFFNKEFLLKEINRVLNKNKHFKSAKIRLTIFRNDGGMYLPETNDISYLIESYPLDYEAYIINQKGISISIFNKVKKPINILSTFKNGNSLIYVLASNYAKNNGFDDALILNEKNEIIEATNSNLFIIIKNKLLTPSSYSGCVNGVMKNVIIECARKLNLNIEENAVITESDLLIADEVFLTNSIVGIKWVLSFNERRYFCKYSKKLIELLNKY